MWWGVKSRSSSLCCLLHAPFISSFLGPNIFLSALFSNTLSLCSSPNARNQFLRPFKSYLLLQISHSRCVFYANEGGWVRQNTTVVGSYLLVRRWRHVLAVLSHLQVIRWFTIDDARTNTGTSGRPSQRSNTKGYSPELRQSPVFFHFSVPFSVLA